ncbi:3-hydroxyacyl-CoA dehydrogenase NAD-binding domain-containing protein [Acidimangrovimonas sediminis]|uniref:3-hydroxyacyl-CoA dehydrogenase NAD-binding domain-containing protein n=1 Tax=Acidimangrovimonas sediminis TaxID=2056283 RepID=UPI000C80316B|nr:3-hydroxyacyl-CoA dehydrogenase NAD-binding domain-containing protein [Acidimangrovimonas sediminis]
MPDTATPTAPQGAGQIVTIERIGNVALVALDNPPVNAAGQALRAALIAAIEALEGTVAAIALYGKGRSFIAGADIREFGKPPQAPSLPEVVNRIEASTTPVVAVLHGVALGGGLEVALGAHARVVAGSVTVGFPEVTLGILPGAGGTQRAPRLAGVGPALDLITTGRRIGAAEAQSLGLVDRIEAGAPRDVALAMAEALAAGSLPHRRTSEIEVVPDPAALTAAEDTVTRRQPQLFAPRRCIEAVAASLRPIAEGLAEERRLFQQCIDSPQRAALVHAFFAEREVAKIPEAGATAREVAHVGVIGGGTMGSGIATAALLAGLRVTLNERDAAALDRGRATIEKNLAGAVKRGKLDAARRDDILRTALQTSVRLEDFAEVDLVVEAVFEDMAVKKEIFTRLDAIAKPGAVLASNTSYLDIDEIAAATSRPGDVLGLHFFSPAHVMRLLEVVVAAKTAPEVTATGFALARKLGKVGVRAGVCDGFIGNRILSHYRKAAEYMVLDGATPWEVDAALQDFGFAMGPFAVMDLAGLDIGWATRKRLAPTRDPRERYSPVADRICENGWFGRKTGQGYYLHGDAAPKPNPEVARIIEAARAEAGITPRNFTADEIVTRYMTAMIAEGARVLEDGIALRPVDIDAVFLFGYGFPRFRGGPMLYADTIGAGQLAARIEDFAREDPFYWRVPALIRRLAETGGSFADLNRGEE